MPYPIKQRAHQFNSIQSVPVSFGLWDTALKFLSPGPRSDVTDHLASLERSRWLLEDDHVLFILFSKNLQNKQKRSILRLGFVISPKMKFSRRRKAENPEWTKQIDLENT